MVIFSNRAFTALLAETKEKITTETGGIFLGVKRSGIWYVVEVIDPGPKSIFQPAYFEYDGDYVRHLANKVNRLYGDRLDVLGLWHRHPGSMDTFSSTDDGTIKEFAEKNNGTTLSAIVNLDPQFRLSVYVASLKPYTCKRIDYEIGDNKIPLDIIDVLPHGDLENQINSISTARPSSYSSLNPNHKDKMMDKIVKYLSKEVGRELKKDANIRNYKDDFDLIIEDYLVDECLFCDEKGITYACDCKENNDIDFIIEDENTKIKLSFYMLDFSHRDDFLCKKPFFKRLFGVFCSKKEIDTVNTKQICFSYCNKLFLYKGSLIKSVWEEKIG